MQTCTLDLIRKVIQAYNDWEGTVAERAEEGESHMRRLWIRDGGGIPGFMGQSLKEKEA